MKLEPPLLVAESTLRNYLLISLPRDDKSNYFHLADYQLVNWEILEKDLLAVVEKSDATSESSSVFGDSYSIVGSLVVPNGRSLLVKTIWMKEKKTGITKFITLYPP